ncbi:winged helix-turn-helix domain-containing protein [Streptomyces sp. NPDC050145]|uniref:winged helix-turn-helix domain-containing protein n=1 Tax=Streptomyces sp. NPDC050145 TaxID=3365602 RepID=UPI0037B02BBE
MTYIGRPSATGIADALRAQISSGELTPGSKLPTQAELAREFGVQRGVVRQALKGLEAEGLLTSIGRGSPPEVAEGVRTAPVRDVTLSARSILGPRLEAAFEAPHVQLDVVTLTSETMMFAFGQLMGALYAQPERPESVRVRVLLPRVDDRLDYPAPEKGWGHDEKLDQAMDRRNKAQSANQRTILTGILARMRKELDIDVSLEFRALRGTPTRKVYLLNRREALFGHYIPGSFLRDVDGYEEPVMLRDVEGAETPMLTFEKGHGARGDAMVDSEQLLFDRVWEHVAQPWG